MTTTGHADMLRTDCGHEGDELRTVCVPQNRKEQGKSFRKKKSVSSSKGEVGGLALSAPLITPVVTTPPQGPAERIAKITRRAASDLRHGANAEKQYRNFQADSRQRAGTGQQ